MRPNRNKMKGANKENAPMTEKQEQAQRALEMAEAKAAATANAAKQSRKWLSKSKELTIDRSEPGAKKKLDRQGLVAAKSQAQSADEAKKMADIALKAARRHFTMSFDSQSKKAKSKSKSKNDSLRVGGSRKRK